MAILEVPELKQDVERARAARRRSQEDILRTASEIRRLEAISHQAQITYGRLASVNEQSPNLVAQQEIDLAQAQSEAAAADLAARQSALQAAQQQLAEAQANEDRASTLAAYANNSAPFDEVVTKRYANIGSMVPQGTQSNQQAMAVVKLTQIDPLRLVFPVPDPLSLACRWITGASSRSGVKQEVRVENLALHRKGGRCYTDNGDRTVGSE